jgi:SNF2 family DNA or RNA helicase
MGLGKTIQLIALLLHARGEDGSGVGAPSLLVCPTSVVGNWQRELARFGPELRVLVHHGADRATADFAAEAARVEWETGAVAALVRRCPRILAGAAVPRPRLRFQPPLIKPCMRFSRTRLSEIVHRVAVGAAGRFTTVPVN